MKQLFFSVFHFINENFHQIIINQNTIMKLKRMNYNSAKLYFTDNNDKIIKIPRTIQVIDYTKSIVVENRINAYNQDKSTEELNENLKPSNDNCYILNWKNSYIIKHKDEIIMNIKNDRVWEISSPKHIENINMYYYE